MSVLFTFRMSIGIATDAPPIPNRTVLRRELETLVENALTALDAMDGDPDMESSGDDEPSLGWSRTMAAGSTDDQEENYSPCEAASRPEGHI